MAGRGGGGCGGRSLFTLLMHMLGPSRLLLYSDFFHTSGCRNLDISNPTVFAGPVGSYFGFSVDFFRKDDGSVSLVVGAPKANTSQPGITEGGAVFLCPWSSGGGQCQVLSFDSTGDKTYLDEAQQTLQTNKSHQWFGASVRSEQSHIVACAPLYRWNVIKANDESGSTEVGSCRLARMQGQKSEIAEFSPCRSEYTNKYYTDRGNYGDRRYCEVGFSVDLTKDGKIVMGAPGGYFFMGQVIVAEVTTIFKESNQSLTQSLSREAQTYEDRSSSYDGYQGYSVAVGEFTGDSIPDYVAGIPHDRDASGTVKIYMGTSYNMLNWVHSFFGKQVSSYFGHSVTATDINGDGTDDIFIGAPLFMDRRKDKKLHEVGQVYLYLQKENNGFSQKPDQILTGWDLYGRFGSAIAPLGDIDQDGYDDIAVGAPFSGGDGRVYIFNGQSDGVDPQYSQVLESPFRRLPSATGFGFALRGGSDVDSNSYPDLIVGAWGASKVAVYRSRTVLSAEAHIALHPDVINPDVKTCAQPHSSQLVSCFDITVCISLQGKKIPPRIVLNAELQLDRMKQRMMRRTLFVSSRQSQGHFQLTLGRDKPSVCTNFSAYLRDESEFKDKLSPILVSLSYSLDNSSSTDPEAPPAFFQGQTTAHIQTRIILDCGPDNVCVPDLKLSAEIHKESFYIGDEDPVLITVTARNEGEGAYETELHVRPPPQIHYQGVLMNREGFSMPICSQRKENGSTVVVCELSNPMKHNEQLHAGLYFSAGNLEQAEGSVVFELQLRSKNSHNPNSEAVQLKVKVSAAAVVTVRGSSSPVEYVLPIVNWQPKPHPATLEDIGPPVEHVYELHNLGPGTVNGKLSLEFPSRSHGNFLLYVFANASEENFRCLTDSPDVDVYKVAKPLTSQNDSSDDKPHLINKREVQETQSLTRGPTVVNCTTTNCMRFICVMTNLEKGRSAVVKVLSRLWVQSFLERPFEDYILQSKAEYRVTSMPYKVQPTVFPSGTAETQTGVVWVTPDNAKEVPVWWIIVAVIGGLILLALLIYIFWKVGFFKRTRPPQDDNEELSPDDTANSVYADMQSKTD